MINSIAKKVPYIADVIRFFKKPRLYLPAKKASLKDFLLLGLAQFILIVPVLLFVYFFSGDRFDSMAFDELEDKPYLLFFLVVVLAPILEEVLFRYHQNRKYFSIILTLMVAALLVSTGAYIFILYVIYLLVLLGFKVSKKDFPISLMVYFTSGFFALVHLTNYVEVDWWSDFYWAPVLIFSQFIGGIILSFIRLHEGLFKAMLFHAMWNGLLSVFLFMPE